jgi:hypothetical protein
MKTFLCFLIAAFSGTSLAQEQLYIFVEDSFSHLVRVYSDVAIGEEAFGINTYYLEGNRPLDVTSDFPSDVTEYVHAGVDTNGTLRLYKKDVDYVPLSFEVESQEVHEISVDISESLTFNGSLNSPDIELDIQAIEGGKLSITLVNTDEFEVFNE